MLSSPALYSLLGPRESQGLRHGGVGEVRAALLAARASTLALADDYERALQSRAMRVGYDPCVNPPVWEWGHVAWFQEWWIARNRERGMGVRCNPDHGRPASALANADALYDSSRVAHRTRWELELPDPAATRAYLARVLSSTLEALDGLPASAGDDELYFFRLVALHECMHAEAATYMARTLGIDVRAPAEPLIDSGDEVAVAAFEGSLGSSHAGFAFDNELDPHPVAVAAFRIDSHPIDWARYLAFVDEHGYERNEFWDERGRAWLASQPAVWKHVDGRWMQRRGPSWSEVDPRHVAVHLTAFEAEAWCRWAGRRLPSEAEWECAARSSPAFRWGGAWEWTSSAFEPYPGFTAHPYRDYSAPWFSTRRVLRGAAAATSPWLADARYRNFFEPHRRDVLAGFRSVAIA